MHPLVLLLQVNKYPQRRTFKAIGEGGQNFASSMQAAVEDILGPVHPDFVHQRLSSGSGSYISVSIGPVTVENSEQVSSVGAALSQMKHIEQFLDAFQGHSVLLIVPVPVLMPHVPYAQHVKLYCASCSVIELDILRLAAYQSFGHKQTSFCKAFIISAAGVLAGHRCL